MRLNEDYMIERYDERNIALWKAVGKAKKRSKSGRQRYGKEWKSIKYYNTFEKAIKSSIGVLTLNQVTFAGDVKTILDELDECKKKIDILAKNLDAQMKDKEI